MAELTNLRLILRNDTAANWASSTLVLLKGEVAIESDTRKIKIGDGTKTFSQLSYANLTPEEISELVTAASTHANKSILDATTASFTTALLTKLNGIAEGANKYTLPTASSSTLGGVKIGTNIAISEGVISVANGTTSAKGVVQLTNSTSSTSTTTAATPSSVKSAYDLANTAKTNAATAQTAADTAQSTAEAAQASADANLATAKSYTDTKVAALVNSAPETMDTLKEVADAIAAHEDVTDALNSAIGTKANASDLTSHTGNTTVHITAAERTAWNKAQANQNAFSNVKVGDVTVAADTTTDTLTIAGENNITINADTTNDKLTITHSAPGATASSYGDSANQTPAYGSTFKVPYISIDSTGHISSISEHTVKIPASDNTDTKVKQTSSTTNAALPLLAASSASPTSGNAAEAVYNTGITVNPSTKTIAATTFSGALSGNANTATKFSSAKSVTLTGQVTGTASSAAGWSLATTVAECSTDALIQGSNTLILNGGGAS